MEANQDRQRLAAVLETLARVLRSEAIFDFDIGDSTDYVLQFAWESLQYEEGEGFLFSQSAIADAEDHATKAAKLAGVEVSPTN